VAGSIAKKGQRIAREIRIVPMSYRLRTIPVLCLSFIATTPASLFGDEPPEVKRLRVDGSDIAALTGLDIYKYEVQLKKGQTVKVTLDVQMEDDGPIANYISHVATASKDGPATLTASFLRQDRKLASVFLSEEQRMEFRVQFEGAASGGLSGFVKNPLASIPLGEKALSIHQEPKRIERTTQLLLLFATKRPEGKPLPILYPKAALHLEVSD